jgi:tetratricopeptide (TPR) repeat protein
MKLMEFTGARRVPLIGRRDLLHEAERRIGRGGIHLIYVEGPGGIGKTALLETILERSQRGSIADTMAGCSVAHEVIDLYHLDVHTSEGLIRKLVEVLGKWSFEKTQEVLALLDRARVTGDMDATGEHARTLQSVFLDEFVALTEEGVVLAFDTLEVLQHERDPFWAGLDEEGLASSASEWLFQSFFPSLQGNVVILLAGRPGDLLERLEAVCNPNPHLLIRHVQLEALDADETREYLRAVAQAEGRLGDGDAATRLWTFSEHHGDLLHFLTRGRPILLALVADMIACDWPLPAPFDQELEDLQEQGEEEWWPQVERALILRIQDSPAPLGETIRALAWLRHGATPELLAQLMDLRTTSGELDIYSAAGYLDQAAQLVLVKLRPADRRIFLHDEMYGLLQKYVLREASDEERDRTHAIIRAYYRDLTRELEQRSEQLPLALASVQARLRHALVEEMHYRLCCDPPMGYAMYFWLSEEALGGCDIEMDTLVRTEFLRTLGELRQGDQFLGTIVREVEVDTAVRWGMRALFLQRDAEAALRIFDRVRSRWGKEAGALKLAWAHLQLYRAAATIRQGSGDHWESVKSLLDKVQETTDEILQAPPENPVVKSRRWRARIIKSLALNYQGYLDRQQGRYLEAVRHFQESAMLQRRLGMATLAPTLTNLSHVLALTGEYRRGRLLAEEAEGLARRRGRDHMLALTLNVRALLECYDGRHKASLRYTDQALEVAAGLPSQRICGLIFCTRARAHRHLWNSLPEAERKCESPFFDQALREANQAVTLLRANPADRVDALLERGCVCREIARLCHQNGKADGAQTFAQKSRQDLERAAVLAAALDLPHKRALAWTHLGWLYYYLGQTKEVEEALDQAYQPFPSGYLFPNQGPRPAMADAPHQTEATLPYWSTLGRAEMLRGYLALDQALATSSNRENGAQLQAAVKHITLSLAYNELVSESHADLDRAEEGLHKRIVQDGLCIKAMHQHAQEVARTQDLAQPTRFQGFLNRLFGPADLWT